MSKYKLLVLDVDGTLVSDSSQTLSQLVINAINNLHGKMNISLCTGRSLEDLDKIIGLLNLQDSFHVVESGAKVIGPGLKTEFVKAITYDEAQNLVISNKSLSDGYGVCVDGNWRENLSQVHEGENITTLTFYIDDSSRADYAMKSLSKFGNSFHIALGTHWFNPNGKQVMVTHKDASKEKSLQYIQEKLNISIEETAAIGDMPNDLPMFKRAGFKVCMGNGHDKLKEAATKIVASVSEDGVAEAIIKYMQ